VVANGYEENSNGQHWCICSATNFGNVSRNRGCFVVILKTLKVVPKILSPSESVNVTWIAPDEVTMK